MRALTVTFLALLGATSSAQPLAVNWARNSVGEPTALVPTASRDGVYVVRETGVVTRYDRYGAVVWAVQLNMSDTDDACLLSDGSLAVVGATILTGMSRMVVQEVLGDGTKLTRIIDSASPGTYASFGRFISGSELPTAAGRRPRFIATGRQTGSNPGVVICMRAPTPDGNTATFKNMVGAEYNSFATGGDCLADRNGDFWFLSKWNDNQVVSTRAIKTSVSNINIVGLTSYATTTAPRFILEMPGTPIGEPSVFALMRDDTFTSGWRLNRIFVNRNTNVQTQLQDLAVTSSSMLNATIDDGKLLVGVRTFSENRLLVASYNSSGALIGTNNLGIWGSTSVYMAAAGGATFGAIYVPPTNNSNRIWAYNGPTLVQTLATSGGVTRGFVATNQNEIYILSTGFGESFLRKFNRLHALRVDIPTPTVYAGAQVPFRVYANGLAQSATTVSLTATDPAIVPPLTLNIAPGYGFINGLISTANVVSSTTGDVRATLPGGPTVSAPLTILPNVPKSVRFSNPTVQGGTNASFTITLQALAAGGGLTVNLSSNNPGVIPVPATTNFTQGTIQKTLVLATNAVMANTTVVVSASKSGVTRAASIVVTP